MADRHGLAVVITAELGGRDGLGYGPNMALMSVVRSAWMLTPEPENRWLLLPLKSVAGAVGSGLACRISQSAVKWAPAPLAAHTDHLLGTGLSLPDVRLPAESSPNPSNSLIGPQRVGAKRARRITAAQWLRQQLAGGPLPVGAAKGGDGTLRAAAKSAGLAWTTVRRAFAELQGISERCPDTGKHMWRLPDPTPAGNEGSAHAEADKKEREMRQREP